VAVVGTGVVRVRGSEVDVSRWDGKRLRRTLVGTGCVAVRFSIALVVWAAVYSRSVRVQRARKS